jgi:hypothetical protein
LGSSEVCVAHFIVDAFAAVTAVGGGTAWATGLESDRLPAEMLRGTQFGSYVIPGLSLAGVVGGANTRNFRDQFLRAVP